MFNPQAVTKINWSKEIPQMYKHHEDLKKTEYGPRIVEIEKESFTPMIFSCTGGMSTETEKVIKKLASKISEKRQENYSDVVSFIRRRLRFDILRSCVISLRGERKSRKSKQMSSLDLNVAPEVERDEKERVSE